MPIDGGFCCDYLTPKEFMLLSVKIWALPAGKRSNDMNTESNEVMHDTSELKDHLAWFIGLGIGLVVLGIFAVTVPLIATFAVESLIGILFIIGGIMMIVHAFKWRKKHSFITDTIIGVIYVAAGLLFLAYPVHGVFTLTLLLTAFFFASGIFKIIHALRMRQESRWGWVLFSGILSLVLGILLLAGLPLTAFWAPGLIVGIDLIFTGSSLLMVSLAVRKHIFRGEVFCIWGECYAT
jgi:uncharacterized membrane protein HdeD (DUF308 family)